MNKQEQKFIDVILLCGINLQKNQYLYIQAPLECYKFVQHLVKRAYELNVANVDVEFIDPLIKQLRYKYLNKDYLKNIPNYINQNFINMYYDKVSILKFNGGLTKQLNYPLNNQIISNQSEKNKLIEYNSLKKVKINTSCSTIIPTKYWAKKIFPNLHSSQALKKLWQHIYQITGCDYDDPITYWDNKIKKTEERKHYLNNQQFEYLHIYDQKTNLSIQLPQNHYWTGGCEYTTKNIRHLPNFPSEEIFSAPIKTGVNGIVYASKPLVYQNQIINDLCLEFRNGKIIKYSATSGLKALSFLINTDEGSCFCGEIALLAHKTIVSQTNTIYYNTLLDENAACHLAIGHAYPTSLIPTISFDPKSYQQHNLNYSTIHCDFMFGRSDTTVIAYKKQQATILIDHGNWVI